MKYQYQCEGCDARTESEMPLGFDRQCGTCKIRIDPFNDAAINANEGKPTDVWEEKNWGKVRHVFNDSGRSFSDLRVVAGQRCSLHFHEDRSNTFQVVDAQIVVEWFGAVEWGCEVEDKAINLHECDNGRIVIKPPARPYRSELLTEGACLVIPPMVWHRFRVLRPGTLLELYFGSDVRLDDIVRLDVGCPDV